MEWSLGNKQALTAIAGFSYFAFGIGVNLFGQTLSDLECILNSTTSQISYGFSLNSVFYCISALTCGWVYNIFNRQWLHITQLALFALSIATVPHLQNINQYLVAQAIFGFLMAGVDTAMNVLILEMWDKDSNPYIQAMHFLWAIGSTVAPLISGPFLAFNEEAILPINRTDCSNESKIVVPYSISGVVVLVAVVVLTAHEILHPYKRPPRSLTKKAELEAKNMCADDPMADKSNHKLPTIYYIAFIALGAAILAFFLGVEVNTSNYLPSYLTRIGMHISKKKGAYMNVLFGITYTSMRGFSIYLATKIKTHVMLYCNLTLVFMANVAILMSTGTSEVLLCASIALLGASLSCIYPAVYAFIEERIDVTNFIGGLFMFLSSLMTTIGPIIIGKSFDRQPKVLIYFSLCNVSIVIVCFILLHSSDRCRRHFLSKKCISNSPAQVGHPLLAS